MTRMAFLLSTLFLLSGCWMFEKTDERDAPILDALNQSIAAFQEAQETYQLPPIPGVPTWILPALAGVAAAVGAFASVLVARGKEQGKIVKVVTDAISSAGGSGIPGTPEVVGEQQNT